MRPLRWLLALAAGLAAADPAASVPVFTAGVACHGVPQNEVSDNASATATPCDVEIDGPFYPSPGTVQSHATASASPGSLRINANSSIITFDARQATGPQVIATQAWGEWLFDDFVATGPPGATTPILAALNLQVSGDLLADSFMFDDEGPLTSSATGNAQIFFEIEIEGIAAGYGEVIQRSRDGVLTTTVDGLLLGLAVSGGHVSATVQSQFLMIPVNQAFRIRVYANAGANASGSVSGAPADEFDFATLYGFAGSDFSGTIQFPTSGPVFDLPAGYTVSSVSAGIVDNQLVTEPSLLALLAAALVGLRGRVRVRV